MKISRVMWAIVAAAGTMIASVGCDDSEAEFDAEMDKLEKEFNAEMDQAEREFNAEMDQAERELNAELDAL